MNQEPKSLDPERLVHRLLDIIERKDVELRSIRQQIEVSLIDKPVETETVRVDLDSKVLVSSEGVREKQGVLEGSREGDASNENLPQFLKSNRLFIYITSTLLMGAVIVTLWPKSSQIAHLNDQLSQAAERHRAEVASAEAQLVEREKLIVQLQKELTGTQQALTSTESALKKTERALRLALHEDSAVTSSGAKAVVSANTPAEEFNGLKAEVTRMRAALVDVQRALVENRKVYIEVYRAVASNESHLFNTNLAMEVESGKLEQRKAETLTKTPDEYLPEEIRIGLNTGQFGGNADEVGLDLSAELPVSMEGLREFAVKLGSVLESKQVALAAMESNISELQKRLLVSIENLKKAQSSLLDLRRGKVVPASS